MFCKSKHFWCPKFHQSTKTNTQGLQYLPPPLPLLPSSPFHQVHISHQQQLCIPSLGYHCMCPCGQGGKEAFQWATAFAIRHEYTPFFVVLYPFPQILLFHSTLSTSIIKTKPPSRFKNSSFLTRFPLTLLPLPPSSSSVKNPGSEAQEIHLPCCSRGGGGGEPPLPPRLACGSGLCAKERPPVSDSRKRNRLPLPPQQAGPPWLQHLPHFRGQQHLHSVSSDTETGCANIATCRSRAPAHSQSVGPRREWGEPWSSSSGLHSCLTLCFPTRSRHSALGSRAQGPALLHKRQSPNLHKALVRMPSPS